MKKKSTGLILITVMTAFVIGMCSRQPELSTGELQRQYTIAKTLAQKDAVVERLEDYYLNLRVPDSLRRRVDDEVATILDTTKIKLAEIVPDTNIYRLESQLQKRLDQAMIARANADAQTSEILLHQAEVIAKQVDAGKGVEYWAPFAGKLKSFTPAQAVIWLRGKRAERLCSSNMDSKFMNAKYYAVLGLKFLQQTPDERVRLNIMQWLQYVLYEHESMYYLSLALGEKALRQAEAIKHPHRAAGLVYHQAQVYAILMENQRALALYENVLSYVEKFKQIRGIEWYTVPALLGLAETQLDVGALEQALATCDKVKKYDLESKNKIRLQIALWYCHVTMGNYEIAENELKKAMQISIVEKDTSNIILCLNNFGVMFGLMKEYVLALDYYNQTRAFFRRTNTSIYQRMLVLNNIASIQAETSDSTGFEEIAREARALLNANHVPFEEARLLHILGYMHKKNFKKYSLAEKYLQKADSLFNYNGYLRSSMGTKIDWVDCLIGLGKLEQAENLTTEIQALASTSDDIEREIEARSRMAQIQYQQGNLEHAVKSSNQLLHAIDTMMGRFNNPDRLRSYRHKIYDHLKNAAVYEIVLQRYDSAFIKLDRAKAFALKNQLLSKSINHAGLSALPRYVNLDSLRYHLKMQDLLIHYLVANDTVYAFALDKSKLHFFCKAVDSRDLQKMVAAYRDSISHTISIFKGYNPERLNTHYAGTAKLGQQLYQQLLGWPQLQPLIQNSATLYFVPDEFLYELPFATLITEHTNTPVFLSTQAAVIMIPNANSVQQMNGAMDSKKFNTKRVLVSINPTFKGAELMMAKIRKVFSLAEELVIDDWANADSSMAKKNVLMKLQENYQVYIFIGHGAANQKYPERSYIELAVKTPGASAKIIHLTLEDLNQINWLGAEMVMLMGCETAGGRLYRGTGIYGLYQGFLSLGTQNVVGSLWKVAVTQTLTQAESFLSAWSAHASPAQALRASQCQMIEELADSEYYQRPHPYFWGSLILFSTRPITSM